MEFVYAGQEIANVKIKANNGKVIENNLIYGNIKGLKIDRETEETIADAMFGLFHGDETEFTEANAVLTATSDENGIFVFENVPFGNWTVKELQPAPNYLPSDDIYRITVANNNQVIEITAVNDRVPEITPPIPDIPQTGDDSNLGFWIGLSAIALSGLIAALIIGINQKKDDER